MHILREVSSVPRNIVMGVSSERLNKQSMCEYGKRKLLWDQSTKCLTIQV